MRSFLFALALLAAAWAETTPLVPGGKIPADVTSTNVVAAATCALRLENARSNSLYAMQLVNIESATSQIVSGVRYDLVLQAGYSSTCRNDGTTHTLAECPVASPAAYQVSVVVQPWLSEPCTLVSFDAVEETTAAAETTQPACGPHSSYSQCASACPPTCETPNPQICIMMCVFGCTCDAGYLLHDGKCILPAECPATTAAAATTTDAPAAAPGGAVPVDVNDADVVAAAMCAMQYENARSNSMYTLQMVNIESATTQVVAGIRYNLVLRAGYSSACRNDGSAHTLADCPVASATLSYNAAVVLQPWLSPACDVLSFAVAPAATAAPAPAPASADTTTAAPLIGGPISGGKTPADVTNTKVVDAASCAVRLENARSNSLYAMQLVSIESATTQTVAGVRYDLVLRAGLSATCRNDGSTHTLAECPVSHPTYFAAAVVVQAWKTSDCSLVSFAPTTAPASSLLGSGPMTGGETDAQPTSALVQSAALCAVTDLNARSNSLYQTQLVQVLSATQQVVSGVKYRINFMAGPSFGCLNDGSAPNLAHCPVSANSAQEYHATVVMQPWRAQPCVVDTPATLVDASMGASAAGSSASSSSSSSNTAVVVGTVVGVIGGLALLAAVALVVIRHRAATVPQSDSLEEALMEPESN